jgi:hypothetical protein
MLRQSNIIEGAKSVTGGTEGSMVQSGLPLFDVDLAFTLLLMSAIMYERSTLKFYYET